MAWYATKKASRLPSLDKSKILVFDVETTGLEPAVDEIIQVTILDGYGTVLFNSYIRPKHHRSWKVAEAVNHINYQAVKDKPFFSDVRAEIQSLFNSASLVVGYNVNFDINFVQAAGIVVSGQIFDVMTAFASYRADVDKTFYRKCKLKECADYFGHCYSPHDSTEDAAVTLSCFDSLISDPRFVTNKPREKSRPKDENSEMRSDHRNSFSLQLSTHRRHSLIFYGIVLIVIAEVLLWLLRGAVVLSYAEYCSCIGNILKDWNENRLESVLYVLIGAGGLLAIIGVIRLILRIPRIIAARVMHFINRFR